MQKLLDKEMPEKPRRRFFGWWWFGLLLLPLAGYGSWYWQQQKEQAKKSQAIARQTPAVDTGNKSGLDDYALSAKSPEITEQTPAIPVSRFLTTNDVQSRQVNTTTILDHFSGTTANINSTNTTNPPTNNPQALEIYCLPAIIDAPTSNLPPALLPSPTAKSAALSKPVARSVSKTWAFGAITSIGSEQFNSINGFSTGLNIDWQFARKWGLRTGLAYNIHTPQTSHRPVASVASQDYASSVDGGVVVVDISTGHELLYAGPNSVYGDSIGNSVLIPVRRLERLEVPISLYWQPVRTLKLFSGLSLIRTLSTKADRENYSGNYVLRLNDEVAEADVSKLSSSELDKWSAYALFGAGIQTGKSFELGLTAKLPFNPYSNTAKSEYDAPLAGNQSYLIATKGNNRLGNAPVFSLYGTLFF